MNSEEYMRDLAIHDLVRIPPSKLRVHSAVSLCEFMEDFNSSSCQSRYELMRALNSIVADTMRSEGLQRSAMWIWNNLGYKPGDSLCEIGPGYGILSLKAALHGLRVTVIEHPDSHFLPDLRYAAKILRGSINENGGSFDIILSDILSDRINDEDFVRKNIGKVDHIVALDMFCPDENTAEYNEAAVRNLPDSYGNESSKRAYFGIYKEPQVIQALGTILRMKRHEYGTIYINHTYSLGKTGSSVRAGRIEPDFGFAELPHMQNIMAVNNLIPKRYTYIPTTRNPLPAARLYYMHAEGG